MSRERAITAARIGAELDAQDELRRADSALAAVREQIAALEGSARLRVVALAALVGRSTDELPALAAKPLPPISAALPDDVRIDLIARRADITASRWRVEAAEKSRESARAEFFPDVSINALAGVQSIDVTTLINYASRVPYGGRRDSSALVRCRPAEGALRRESGCGRFGRGELSGNRGRRPPGTWPRRSPRSRNWRRSAPSARSSSMPRSSSRPAPLRASARASPIRARS